jgi:hypothetical protein
MSCQIRTINQPVGKGAKVIRETRDVVDGRVKKQIILDARVVGWISGTIWTDVMRPIKATDRCLLLMSVKRREEYQDRLTRTRSVSSHAHHAHPSTHITSWRDCRGVRRRGRQGACIGDACCSC